MIDKFRPEDHEHDPLAAIPELDSETLRVVEIIAIDVGRNAVRPHKEQLEQLIAAYENSTDPQERAAILDQINVADANLSTVHAPTSVFLSKLRDL